MASKKDSQRKGSNLLDQIILYQDIIEKVKDDIIDNAYEAIRPAYEANYKEAVKSVNRHRKEIEDGKPGGKKSGEVRREKAKPTREAWQAEAEKIWQSPRNSKLSNSSVAVLIAKKIGGKADYIRHHIKKPLP